MSPCFLTGRNTAEQWSDPIVWRTVNDKPWFELVRTVLPQHTDHAGVMWHGAYVGWLEEVRVSALNSLGSSYAECTAGGLALAVVSMEIRYILSLPHGARVQLLSRVQSRSGVRMTWENRFVWQGKDATTATVQVVPMDLERGRVVRHWPASLEQLVQHLLAASAGRP